MTALLTWLDQRFTVGNMLTGFVVLCFAACLAFGMYVQYQVVMHPAMTCDQPSDTPRKP